MHARIMMTSFLAIPLLLASEQLFAGSPATPWDRYEDIPGATEVQKAQATSRRLVRTGRAGEVRWDTEGNRAWTRSDGEWLVLDLSLIHI